MLSLDYNSGPAVYDLETRRWIVQLPGSAAWPSWSKDSRFLYFLRLPNDPGVFRVSVQSGKEEKVVDLDKYQFTGWFGVWFGLDPDDAPLLLHNAGSEDLYALTLERSEIR